MAISCVVAYSLFLMPQILSFWLMNTSSIAEISDSFWDFNSMPMDIYTNWIQMIGIFILPIFIITNFPPMFVLHRLPPVLLAWSAALPLILLVVVRLLWQHGLKNYSSASS
jgi:ABC-2 type transport system permease protein